MKVMRQLRVEACGRDGEMPCSLKGITMKRRYLLSFGTAAATIPCPALAAPPTIRFTSLPANRRIVIELKSNGCFHSFTCRFEYSRVPSPRMRVEATDVPGRPGGTDLGVVALLSTDVTRLDNLLNFYRKGITGMCTTHNDITFTVVEGGRVLATESFRDSSCYADDMLDADPADLKMLGIKDPAVLSLFRITATADKRPDRVDLSNPIPLLPPGMGEHTRAQIELQARRAKAESALMVKRLGGYAGALRNWRIEETDRGWINVPDESLFVQMKARNRRPVDAIWWFDPLVRGQPLYSWPALLRAHAAIERAVIGRPWLEKWKQSGLGRSLEAQVWGTRLNAESEFDDIIRPLWRRAGLKGQPTIGLLLRRGDDWCGTVYLGNSDSCALLTNVQAAERGRQTHWIDRLPVGTFIIRSDGTWRQLTDPR